jgi:hypothetical protein
MAMTPCSEFNINVSFGCKQNVPTFANRMKNIDVFRRDARAVERGGLENR